MGLLVLAATIIPETTAHQPPGHRHPAGPPHRPSSGWSPPWPGWSCPSPTSPRPPLTDPTFGAQFPVVRVVDRGPARRRDQPRPGARRRGRRVGGPGTVIRRSRWRRKALAVLPLALAGHAAGSASHDTAVNSLAVHLVAAVPLGGRPARPGGPAACCWARCLAVSVARYAARWPAGASPLVALSGISERPGSAWALLSAPGLAVRRAGDRQGRRARGFSAWPAWQQRRVVIGRMATDEAARAWLFARLAVGEVVVMGAAFGLATALSRSASTRPRPGAGRRPTPSRASDRLRRTAARAGSGATG